MTARTHLPVAAFCAVVAVAGCHQPSVTAPPPRVIRIANTSSLSKPLSEASQRGMPDVSVVLVGERTGDQYRGVHGVTNPARVVLDGHADLAVGSADTVYEAYLASLTSPERDAGNLRGIAVLPATPLQLAVRHALPVSNPADLQRRRVRVGPEGVALARLVLESFGVLDTVRMSTSQQSTRSPEVAAAITTGAVDAAFVSGHYPVESVRLATERGATIVPLVGPSIDRLRERYPFIRSLMIPAHTYSGQSRPIQTIGIDVVLFCREGLDEDLVYRLTREFFTSMQVLRDVQPSMRLLELDHVPATPIPLHDGAIRYYRESELLR